MSVTRCICHDVSFADLKQLADAKRLDLAGLKARTGCCTGCGMCEAYVRLMLRTGETRFAVLSAERAAEVMRGNEKGRASGDARP